VVSAQPHAPPALHPVLPATKWIGGSNSNYSIIPPVVDCSAADFRNNVYIYVHIVVTIREVWLFWVKSSRFSCGLVLEDSSRRLTHITPSHCVHRAHRAHRVYSHVPHGSHSKQCEARKHTLWVESGVLVC
jgi:hypothetical protein